MTKLYKNTGVEYEITYPPPPEPPPPAPDPDSPSPPGDNVDSDSPSGGEPVDRNEDITFVSCTTSDGYKGVRMYIGGNPSGSCMKLDYQGMGG